MNFSKRAELAERYHIWLTNCNKMLEKEGDIARISDCPLSVITFLDNKGYLPDRQRWIPVSERLPEEMGTYMTTVDYGKHGLATGQRYYHGQGLGWEDDCVIAWMPLPEPYKVESEVIK